MLHLSESIELSCGASQIFISGPITIALREGDEALLRSHLDLCLRLVEVAIKLRKEREQRHAARSETMAQDSTSK